MLTMEYCPLGLRAAWERKTCFGGASRHYYSVRKRKSKANDAKRSKNSIFIDEKIYSVDRLKKTARSKKSTDGFTYLQVWQK